MSMIQSVHIRQNPAYRSTVNQPLEFIFQGLGNFKRNKYMKTRSRYILTFSLFLATLCALAPNAFSTDDASTPAVSTEQKNKMADTTVSTTNLMSSGYSLETDDQSASESLERVSGKVDMGFSSPENSFKSPDHYAPGPFGKEKSEEQKQNGDLTY